ncbi:MAG TPA: hypothetical protein VJI12_00145 [archaeon]|nr:hypothetical protein [archaeon]
MQLKIAADKAAKEEKIRTLRGYFLGSCFACIKNKNDIITEWTFLYYNTSTGKAVDCFVNDKFVTVSDETRAVNPVKEMNIDDLHIGIEKAIDIADKKFSKNTINILITLHKREHLMWTINMISADMNAITYDIDAGSGKILREETTSLARKL